MFSALPDNLTIAGGKQYVFIFSSWSTLSSIRNKVEALRAYADNILAAKNGLTETIITLTPKYNMPFETWKKLFFDIGLKVQDAYAGESSSTPSPVFNPVQNVATYWEPKIERVTGAISSGVSSAASYTRMIAISGAVIVTGLLLLNVTNIFRRK